MDLTLSELLTHLVSEKNFYALVANHMRREVRPGIGTMGVRIHHGRVVLMVDPEFLKNSSLSTCIFGLEHEMLHIVLDHIPRYLEILADCLDEEGRLRTKHVSNIAMDCAINSLLRGNPYFARAEDEIKQLSRDAYDKAVAEAIAAGAPPDDTGIMPLEEASTGMCLPEKYQLPDKRSYDFYQRELSNQVQTMALSYAVMCACGQGPSGQSHAGWEEVEGDGESDEDGNEKDGGKSAAQRAQDATQKVKDGAGTEEAKKPKPTPKSGDELRSVAEQIRQQMRHVLRKAVRDSSTCRGTVPGSIAEWLQNYLEEPKVPWWEVLTSRIKTSKRSKPDRSISKPNRMLVSIAEEDHAIIPALGRHRDPKFRVFYFVDTSGSQSTESLNIALSELDHLLRADTDMEVRYMQGDCDITFDKVFKTGDTLPREIYGRGGTDFDTYFAYMGKYLGDDETAPDIVIVQTDGYAPAVQEAFRMPYDVPVIWLLSSGGSANSLEGYGEVIHCDPNDNKRY